MRVIINLVGFKEYMSGKRNWGDNMKHRMDKHLPPPVVEKERVPVSRRWKKKYECKPNKGHHSWKLVVPEYHKRDRTGRTLEIDITEFYTLQDAKYYTEKREKEEAIKNGTYRGWYGFLFWGGRRRHWECVACKKQDSDTEEKPDKWIRNNLAP